MKREVEKTPDTSEAETWLDSDTFVAWGKVWQVDLNGTVVYLREVVNATK